MFCFRNWLKLGEQTKGACLVPKRALRVMEGEVNRIMQLTSNSVIPIMYQVPRKTYRDFHGDLYPDTNGYKTDLTVTQWLKGINTAVPKMSLDPAKRELGDAPIIVSVIKWYFSIFFLLLLLLRYFFSRLVFHSICSLYLSLIFCVTFNFDTILFCISLYISKAL